MTHPRTIGYDFGVVRLKTLLIGIGTLVVAAAVAVTPAVEAQSSKDYALGENCPLSGHGDTI